MVYPKIRSIEKIADKWAEVTPGRSAYYEDGVRNPKEDWGEEAYAAKETWKAGITQAAARDAYGKGVSRAGTKTWQEGCIRVGITRWGPGVAASKNRYRERFGPYVDVIAKTDIGVRGPTGSPQNYDRVRRIGDALRAAKIK